MYWEEEILFLSISEVRPLLVFSVLKIQLLCGFKGLKKCEKSLQKNKTTVKAS